MNPASLYAPPAADAKDAKAGESAAAAPRKVSFEALSARARERGEVAIGVHLEGEKEPRLNPPRGMRLQCGPNDQLIVLGDSF